MAYDSAKPVTGGSLVAADMRENFRAIIEDDIVEGVEALGIVEGLLAASAVAQAKLKTSQGSVTRGNAGYETLTLPGGEYGFYPQTRGDNETALSAYVGGFILGKNVYNAGWEGGSFAAATDTGYITWITLYTENNGLNVYAQQRYVTASGEVFWIFILRDKITKNIISMYQAPDHPCMGNGGKPLLVSHPFGSYDETKHEIIVINPTDKELQEMRAKTIQPEDAPDKDLLDVVSEEYEIDESSTPAWPTKEVTVGLPPDWDEVWRTGKSIAPIKKIIPKVDYISCRKLKLK